MQDERKHPNLKVGDTVRLSKRPGPFTKGYTQQWTEEIFTISKIHPTLPPVYSVQDYNKQDIDGRFYEQELQKVGEKKEFLIEQVLGERKVGKRKEYLVKWLGYDKSWNSYIPASSITHINKR